MEKKEIILKGGIADGRRMVISSPKVAKLLVQGVNKEHLFTKDCYYPTRIFIEGNIEIWEVR